MHIRMVFAAVRACARIWSSAADGDRTAVSPPPAGDFDLAVEPRDWDDATARTRGDDRARCCAGASSTQVCDDVLVRDVDHDAGQVVAWVGQDEDPEGPLAAHADREGGDVLEAARKPHLP